MRRCLVLISLTAALTLGAVYPALAAPSAEERVRAMRRQVEENDAQIRALEATLRKLQGQKPGAEREKPARSLAPTGGEIAAWSSSQPAKVPTVSPVVEQPIVEPPAAIVAPPRRVPPLSALAERRAARKRDRLAGAPLKAGMTQVKVWETLGPPEFVRGRRTEVQYWHYGPGWIRFQAGRITRWEPGSNELQAARE
jgi:hypothetical protein